MGLKSGSRDAGLDESDDDAEHDAESTQPVPTDEGMSSASLSTTADNDRTDRVADSESEPVSHRPTIESLPYTLRRDKVNEGREQVPYFLRGEIIDAEDNLQDTLEELLGETVYKSDYREASMVVAQRHPELVAEVLREWGYDLDAT